MEGQDPEPTDTSAPVRGPVVGSDELNLIELPFTLLSDDNRQGLNVLHREWWEGGRQCWVRVSPNVTYGLPLFAAEEVVIAALELTRRQDFRDRVVRTTKMEMLELMRWRVDGQHRRQLVQCFLQLAGTTLHTNRFYDYRRQIFVNHGDTGFHIISNFSFEPGQRRRSSQLDLPLSWFEWDRIVWESLQAGYTKTLDTATYFSLSTNVAQRLFRYVDKWLSHGGLEIDLRTLTIAKLGMSEQLRYPSKMIEKLTPAIEELNRRRLARVYIEPNRQQPSGYQVIIAPAQAIMAEHVPIVPLGSHQADPATQGLVAQLVSRGIAPRTARRLARQHAANIPRHVAAFDRFMAQPDRGGVRKPAAWLRTRIEQNWSGDRPPESMTAEERQAEEEEQQRGRQDLLVEYQEQLDDVRRDVAEWSGLPLEQRIDHRRLDEWETGFRLRCHRNPTAEEREAERQRLMARVPSLEQEWASRVAELRLEFDRRASQAGLGPLEFPAASL